MKAANKIPCRKSFTDTLLELAREDKRIVAVTSDASGSATLTDFAKALPEQFGILVLFRHPFRRYESRRGVKVELANLLLQGHPAHEFIDETVHLGLGGAGRQGSSKHKKECQVLFHTPKLMS